MITVGRLCTKISGRDAGKKAVVLLIIDNNYALIDGETRRKKCNITHLEPMQQMLDIQENASHEQVKEAFRNIGITLKDKRKSAKPSDL